MKQVKKYLCTLDGMKESDVGVWVHQLDYDALAAQVSGLQQAMDGVQPFVDKIVARLADAERERDALRERAERAEAMLPDVPKREAECTELWHWRDRALYLESQWAGCSHHLNRVAGQRDALRGALEWARFRILAASSAEAMKDPTLTAGLARIDAALERQP